MARFFDWCGVALGRLLFLGIFVVLCAGAAEPDGPDTIVPVIDLAATTLAAGDAEGADKLLRRANDLLDKYPEQDGALRLRVLILQSDRLVGLGRLADSNQVLYKALDLARSTTAIGPLAQANVLERLAANEARRGRASRARSFATDALKLREKHFGKNSPEFAAALLRMADWYRYMGEFGLEIDAEKKALAILERQFGPRNPRLAIPLIHVATARIAQRRDRGDAERNLQRAIGLDFGSGADDVYIKAEILATMADLQVVFGKPEDSTPLYAQAWHTIADHEQLGVPAANQYFGRVRQLFIATPDIVASIGMIDLSYTVTPVGTLDEVRIVENSVPTVDGVGQAVKSEAGASMWRAMRRSRYRPRVAEGAPIATPDLSYSLEFCLDPGEIVPICKGNANASAVR
ncbi:MAG: tetratricopeptide repeat protein [Gammaproteobacteria bacterium]|nr:tetratricopeptide repeat protein [Gammaproteobacteria bacterium]